MPGIERQHLKKFTADQDGLLQLLHRWWKEAAQAEPTIKRIAVAYEVGRDSFWLAQRRGVAIAPGASSIQNPSQASPRTTEQR